MENKINVAELLKDCPNGMELDCVMFDNVTLVEVDFDNCDYPISISVSGERHSLSRYGEWFDEDVAKCVIFPKGKTTWEGFVPPYKFKEGDIVCTTLNSIAIIKEESGAYYTVYCGVMEHNVLYFQSTVTPMRLATEEEKQKLFDAIKDNGYRWNAETKTLDKLIVPMFKVGDKIKLKNSPINIISTVTKINDDGSICVNNYTWVIKYELQYKFELAPDKFDISTLQPYISEVLTRDDEDRIWQPGVWGLYDKGHRYPYITTGNRYRYCIPYKGNEHLFGATDDCNEYYKTWEE